MKSILEKLYECIPINERETSGDPETAALVDAVSDFVEEWGDRLQFGEAEELRSFFPKACRLRDREAAAAFETGFRMGARMMLELGAGK